MNFININDETIENDILKNEFKNAKKIARVKIGENILFFSQGMKKFYIAYKDIYRVFRRIKAVTTRFFKSKGEIQLEYLVLCSKKSELCEIDLPDADHSNQIIEIIQNKNPNVKIGKKN